MQSAYWLSTQCHQYSQHDVESLQQSIQHSSATRERLSCSRRTVHCQILRHTDRVFPLAFWYFDILTNKQINCQFLFLEGLCWLASIPAECLCWWPIHRVITIDLRDSLPLRNAITILQTRMNCIQLRILYFLPKLHIIMRPCCTNGAYGEWLKFGYWHGIVYYCII